MAAGIYAVANIGTLKLYVGEVRHLKTRWPKMVAQLEQGTFPDSATQEAWNVAKGDRRFTFHTAADIQADPLIRGRKLFLKDYQSSLKG
jgi:hypothetical protein